MRARINGTKHTNKHEIIRPFNQVIFTAAISCHFVCLVGKHFSYFPPRFAVSILTLSKLCSGVAMEMTANKIRIRYEWMCETHLIGRSSCIGLASEHPFKTP